MALNWGVQLLRVSAFSPASIAIVDADWKFITGQDESEARQNIPGGKMLSGAFGSGRLTLGVLPRRVDIVLTATSTQASEQTLPVMSLWEEGVRFFVSATLPWIEKASFPVVRMAFGATLFSQTNDRKTTNEVLQPLLKSLVIDPEAMRDVLYRVNWPAESNALPHLVINRLTTWSAARIVTKLIQITGNQAAASSTPDVELHAASLEIDHNTDEAWTVPFDRGLIGPIYRELVELARENAAKGERP